MQTTGGREMEEKPTACPTQSCSQIRMLGNTGCNLKSIGAGELGVTTFGDREGSGRLSGSGGEERTCNKA